MSIFKTVRLLGAAALLLFVSATIAGDPSGVDAEGFIQKWLVLAPIPFADGESGGDALDKEQIKDEAKLKPKAGTKAKIRNKELTWKEHVSKEHLVDFNELLGGVTEDSVAYAVTYIVVPEELKNVKMKTGSDDQCKVYINGKEVFKNTDPRAADKDQDTTEVVLRKGVNVLVAKVVNETFLWSFCVRFTDKDDKPLKNLKSKTTE
jgi:hypothetical protein